MGKTIVLWASEREYGNTSAVMAALACSLGIGEEKNVAVTALPGRPSAFLEAFDIRIPEKIRSGKDNTIGFLPLLQKAVYEMPTEKAVRDMGVRIINKGPLLFPWFDSDESTITEKNAVTLITKVLKEFFDYVLIDAGYGKKNEYADLLIKNADVVLVLLPQEKSEWKRYFDNCPLTATGRLIYVITDYMEASNYTESWFSHHFGRDSIKVRGIPQYAGFFDACMEGRVAELFLEAEKGKKKQGSRFFKAVKRLMKGVQKK